MCAGREPIASRAGNKRTNGSGPGQTLCAGRRPVKRVLIWPGSACPPKRTSLGDGWFVTTRNTWYVGTEPVASMRWRILKFRPPGDGPVLVTAGTGVPTSGLVLGPA
jgi:hypothetical protein